MVEAPDQNETDAACERLVGAVQVALGPARA
jgi:hypothetical protein